MRTPEWDLVSGIELFGDLETFPWAPSDHAERRVGAVIARPHATGWFFSAHHRSDLSPVDIEHFAEFARVRGYLLLTDGPRVTTWEPYGADTWIAWSTNGHVDVVDAIPDAVPAHWP